ncbi:hypothetical protein BV898_09218 [Hypsibius exemplaris]|uniref:G-protein coupled receptors family 1 profile domain-containing protein n=1 Tax=Hypsibius exemplaris TaxID=2072580 RepID=A0A1W0WNC7_HYPEX|nr:hypothetical protein BV898_09218 [Hypsibius exemplaris]
MSVALNETAHLSNLSYVNVSLLLAHLPRASSNGNHFNVTNSSSSMNTTLNPLDYSKEQLQMIQLVLGPLYPILLACCTIGNVLNLIVLFREKTKGSTNVYMMSVAISDLFILWLQLPYYLYNISLTIRAQVGFRKSYKDYDGVRRWGQETFMQLSDWTLIVFSLARLMAIVKPFSFRWLQTARTARIACAILLVLAGIFTIYIPIQWYCEYYRVTKTAKDPPWLTHWGAVQDQAEVAMTIFKFFALLVLNVVLVMAIRRQQTSHIGKMRAGQQSNSNRKYRNSNIILISSVLLYLVCQFPSLIVRLLTILDDIYHQYEFRKTHRHFANPFVLFALFGNYSVNFILYLMVSKKFRRQCAQLFAPCCGHPLVGKWRSRMSRLSTTRSRDDDDDGDSDDAEPQEMRISSITSNKDGVRLQFQHSRMNEREDSTAIQNANVVNEQPEQKPDTFLHEVTVGAAVAMGSADGKLSMPNSKTNNESTTVLIVEMEAKLPFWRNWKFLTIAVVIMVYNTLTGVADQQIAKEVNSPTFSAPFFLLWCMAVLRTLTFPVYLPIGVAYAYFKRLYSTSTDKLEGVMQKTSVMTIITDICRDSALVFGPPGLTWKRSTLYLVPFALLWIGNNGLFYMAVTFAEVSECVAVSSSTTVFVYLISWIFLKEKFILFKLFGMLLCIAGVVLTVWASGTSIGASQNSLIAAGLVLGSSVCLALQAVGFKRYLGSTTISQIALFQSLTSLANIVLTWPLFLSLKLTGRELWDFATVPFGLMTISGFFGSSGVLCYYVGVSLISPIFVSLSKPLQIMINNGIDIGIKGISFGVYHGIGAGLVVVGFLMMIAPDNLVSLEIRAIIVRLRPGRRTSVEKVELHSTLGNSAKLSADLEAKHA